jgi:hypothetical protein
MIVVLLILHGLLAVALLGAVTHQALSTRRLKPNGDRDSFMARYRSVHDAAFPYAVAILFSLTSLGGGFLYPQYRIDVRPSLEERQMSAANGVFEIKEHLAAIGLGILPAYLVYWRRPLRPEYAAARRGLTWILAFVTWWSFLVGHVLNNIKGLVP